MSGSEPYGRRKVPGGSGRREWELAAREQAVVVVGGPQERSSSGNVKPGGVRRRVGIRVVESEGANAVELVNGEMFTSGPRVDPLPSTGARQVELHDGARVRPRPVLVCGVQPVLRRAVRMPEGSSVDATELPLGQRMGGGRGEGSRASRRSAGGKVGAEEGAGQATLTAIGGAMVLGTTGGAEPLGGGERR